MKKHIFLTGLSIFVCFVMMVGSTGFARTAANFNPHRPSPTAAAPAYGNMGHDVGKIVMAVANDGTFGLELGNAGDRDYFTGEQLYACEYPKDSRTRYLFAGDFWIGAVLGHDTLVSTGADGWDITANEFHPDVSPLGDPIYRSSIDPAKPEFDGSVSEQDYISVYYDTCLNCAGVTADDVDGRPHRPLNVEVTQRSYAWSYEYAEDFVLFDYEVKNIGAERLNGVYLGIYVDADIHAQADDGQNGAQDDLCGFLEKIPAQYLPSSCPADSDVVNVAWTIDNDGQLDDAVNPPVPNVTAMRIVRTPSDSLIVSFNWWISNGNSSLDFGPQARANPREHQHGGLGTPSGDRAKYFYLQNNEFDYNQYEVATIDAFDPYWLDPPEQFKNLWAYGLDTRYLLSFGPFDVEPGQTLPVSFAYVGGEDVHTSTENFENFQNSDPGDPAAVQDYEDGLNFLDLGLNATWADWIYDNPGIDTDNDGYFGEATICYLGGDSTQIIDTIWDSTVEPPVIVDIDTTWLYDLADTVWRKGDGVPDFQGASPPPAPNTVTSAYGENGLRVIPEEGRIRVVWNGIRSENAQDIFSREKDFEGYRVYYSLDERRASYVLLQSFDIEDYNKWVYDTTLSEFVLLETPFLLNELIDYYAGDDENWHPLNFPRSRPFSYSGVNPITMEAFDSIFFFEPQDYNQSILGNYEGANTDIRKIYPEAPMPPTLDYDSIPPENWDTYVTEDGFFKYFEYEYTIENLQSTVPYWINVTAFDYGSPTSGLPSLETNPTVGPVVTFAQWNRDNSPDGDEGVYVYPNPYRIDADYRGRGYEGRVSSLGLDRDRRIHFANLPAKCTISIFTLDGDLVREINHDINKSDPLWSHDTWDLITRNTQQVVSGMYYFVVEDLNTGETEIGKLVIIM